jgi:hypothetical protein
VASGSIARSEGCAQRSGGAGRGVLLSHGRLRQLLQPGGVVKPVVRAAIAQLANASNTGAAAPGQHADGSPDRAIPADMTGVAWAREWTCNMALLPAGFAVPGVGNEQRISRSATQPATNDAPQPKTGT